MLRRTRPSTPYEAVLRHPALRRLLPALAVSAVGDGMSLVAVSWLALQLAPAGAGPVWVAVCTAATVLPGAALTLLRRRTFAPAAAARVGLADALLHAAALGAVPVLSGAGVLDVRALALLLALSSPLRTWGFAARFTLVARALPEQHRVAGNAAMSAIAEGGALAGPPLAGVVVAAAGPVWAVGADAATFAVLALAFAGVGRHLPVEAAGAEEPGHVGVGSEGPSVLRRPAVTGVVGLTAGLFALYGLVDVALPVHAAEDLHAPAGVLAAFVTAFGVGGLLGGLTAGWLGRWPATALTPVIVVGWGLALLPLGLGAPTAVAVAAFGVGAFVYGPYMAVVTALVQRATPPDVLPRALATQAAVLNLAVPAGGLLAGPLVVAIGARPAVLVSALGTVALGLAAATAVTAAGRRAGSPTGRARG